MFSDVIEGHLLGYRSNFVQSHLTPQALNIEFLGVPIPSMRLQSPIAGLEPRLGCA